MNVDWRSTALSIAGFDRLAQRVSFGDAAATVELRARLLAALAPVVRLALRRGVGIPALVEWVRRTGEGIARGTRADSLAPEVTRLLCVTLMRGMAVNATANAT